MHRKEKKEINRRVGYSEVRVHLNRISGKFLVLCDLQEGNNFKLRLFRSFHIWIDRIFFFLVKTPFYYFLIFQVIFIIRIRTNIEEQVKNKGSWILLQKAMDTNLSLGERERNSILTFYI